MYNTSDMIAAQRHLTRIIQVNDSDKGIETGETSTFSVYFKVSIVCGMKELGDLSWNPPPPRSSLVSQQIIVPVKFQIDSDNMFKLSRYI